MNLLLREVEVVFEVKRLGANSRATFKEFKHLLDIYLLFSVHELLAPFKTIDKRLEKSLVACVIEFRFCFKCKIFI